MGPLESWLVRASAERTLLAVLIDPFNVNGNEAKELSSEVEKGGADLIFVGGSVGAGARLSEVVRGIKEGSSIPVVLFPGNVDGITPEADAILFMSLLNSTNPYWIIQAQALAAPAVRLSGLEAIPTAYLIVEPGERSAAGWVGSVNSIPRKKPELALAYAWAAEMLGMRWIYLEAGSGAEKPVPQEMVRIISKRTSLKVIVGGGLRSPEAVRERAASGANIVVVGTHIESGSPYDKVKELRAALDDVKVERSQDY